MKKTLLRRLLIDSLVLGVVASQPDWGSGGLMASSHSSIVMMELGRILLRGILKFFEARSFRGLLLKVLLRYPNIVKIGTLFLGIMPDLILQ